METQDQKILYGLAKTTERLAKTVEANGIELGALRLTTQALFGVVSMRNDLSEEFADALVRVMEADEATMLNTSLTDQQLAQRREWMLRLLPPNVRLQVQIRSPR